MTVGWTVLGSLASQHVDHCDTTSTRLDACGRDAAHAHTKLHPDPHRTERPGAGQHCVYARSATPQQSVNAATNQPELCVDDLNAEHFQQPKKTSHAQISSWDVPSCPVLQQFVWRTCKQNCMWASKPAQPDMRAPVPRPHTLTKPSAQCRFPQALRLALNSPGTFLDRARRQQPAKHSYSCKCVVGTWQMQRVPKEARQGHRSTHQESCSWQSMNSPQLSQSTGLQTRPLKLAASHATVPMPSWAHQTGQPHNPCNQGISQLKAATHATGWQHFVLATVASSSPDGGPPLEIKPCGPYVTTSTPVN